MIWIIGSSSEYSKAVASQFNNVKIFGRANINYNDSFDKFIDQQTDMPNKIFINIKLEQNVAIETGLEYQKLLSANVRSILTSMVMENKIVFLFLQAENQLYNM